MASDLIEALQTYINPKKKQYPKFAESLNSITEKEKTIYNNIIKSIRPENNLKVIINEIINQLKDNYEIYLKLKLNNYNLKNLIKELKLFNTKIKEELINFFEIYLNTEKRKQLIPLPAKSLKLENIQAITIDEKNNFLSGFYYVFEKSFEGIRNDIICNLTDYNNANICDLFRNNFKNTFISFRPKENINVYNNTYKNILTKVLKSIIVDLIKIKNSNVSFSENDLNYNNILGIVKHKQIIPTIITLHKNFINNFVNNINKFYENLDNKNKGLYITLSTTNFITDINYIKREKKYEFVQQVIKKLVNDYKKIQKNLKKTEPLRQEQIEPIYEVLPSETATPVLPSETASQVLPSEPNAESIYATINETRNSPLETASPYAVVYPHSTYNQLPPPRPLKSTKIKKLPTNLDELKKFTEPYTILIDQKRISEIITILQKKYHKNKENENKTQFTDKVKILINVLNNLQGANKNVIQYKSIEKQGKFIYDLLNEVVRSYFKTLPKPNSFLTKTRKFLGLNRKSSSKKTKKNTEEKTLIDFVLNNVKLPHITIEEFNNNLLLLKHINEYNGIINKDLKLGLGMIIKLYLMKENDNIIKTSLGKLIKHLNIKMLKELDEIFKTYNEFLLYVFTQLSKEYNINIHNLFEFNFGSNNVFNEELNKLDLSDDLKIVCKYCMWMVQEENTNEFKEIVKDKFDDNINNNLGSIYQDYKMKFDEAIKKINTYAGKIIQYTNGQIDNYVFKNQDGKLIVNLLKISLLSFKQRDRILVYYDNINFTKLYKKIQKKVKEILKINYDENNSGIDTKNINNVFKSQEDIYIQYQPPKTIANEPVYAQVQNQHQSTELQTELRTTINNSTPTSPTSTSTSTPILTPISKSTSIPTSTLTSTPTSRSTSTPISTSTSTPISTSTSPSTSTPISTLTSKSTSPPTLTPNSALKLMPKKKNLRNIRESLKKIIEPGKVAKLAEIYGVIKKKKSINQTNV